MLVILSQYGKSASENLDKRYPLKTILIKLATDNKSKTFCFSLLIFGLMLFSVPICNQKIQP
jgi:hypothetical protein